MSPSDAVAEAIRARRSVRSFRDDPVERGALERLIGLATWAPSAGNRQDRRFTVVTSKPLLGEMAGAVRARWDAVVEANRDSGVIDEVRRYAEQFSGFEAAPVVILVSARRPDSFQRHILGDRARATAGSAASAAMAAQSLMLAAHAEGLGTCCMTGALAAHDELAGLAGLGRREEIVCIVALGWPAEAPARPPRKPVQEVTRFL